MISSNQFKIIIFSLISSSWYWKSKKNIKTDLTKLSGVPCESNFQSSSKPTTDDSRHWCRNVVHGSTCQSVQSAEKTLINIQFSHYSSVGEIIHLTFCPLHGLGSIPGQGGEFQGNFPWLITHTLREGCRQVVTSPLIEGIHKICSYTASSVLRCPDDQNGL